MVRRGVQIEAPSRQPSKAESTESAAMKQAERTHRVNLECFRAWGVVMEEA